MLDCARAPSICGSLVLTNVATNDWKAIEVVSDVAVTGRTICCSAASRG